LIAVTLRNAIGPISFSAFVPRSSFQHLAEFALGFELNLCCILFETVAAFFLT
jgi:hypothetical protein